jgi:hypothetical protein
VPSGPYYAQQARLLFSLASATADPANAAHLKGRANKYLLLAGKLPGDALQQQPSLQDQPHQQQQQQQQSGKGD